MACTLLLSASRTLTLTLTLTRRVAAVGGVDQRVGPDGGIAVPGPRQRRRVRIISRHLLPSSTAIFHNSHHSHDSHNPLGLANAVAGVSSLWLLTTP